MEVSLATNLEVQMRAIHGIYSTAVDQLYLHGVSINRGMPLVHNNYGTMSLDFVNGLTTCAQYKNFCNCPCLYG